MTSFRRRKWQDFASILKDLRRSEKWARHLSRHPVFRLWGDVVGKTIAEVAQPVVVSRSLLRVEVADSAWMQELQLMGDDILRKVNAVMENGEFKEIRFQLGNSWKVRDKADEAIAAERERQVFRQPVSLSSEDESAVRDMLRGFEDDEFRDRVEHLLERMHSRPPLSEEEEGNAMNLEERG